MNKLLLTSAAAVVLAASSVSFAGGTPTVSHAVANPWYVGIGINHNASTYDELRNSSNYKYELTSSGFGGNIFAGYRMSRFFGTELGLAMFGENQYRATGTGTSSKLKYKSQWNVSYVGQVYVPITSWFHPYIFAGGAYMHSNISLTNSPTKDSYSGFGLVYGAGLLFTYNNFGVRASYTDQAESHSAHFNTITSNGITFKALQTIDYVSLDVLYRFG